MYTLQNTMGFHFFTFSFESSGFYWAMRILLINPPDCGRSIPEERYGIDSIKRIFRGEPLALESLAGNLAGHDLQILDLKSEPQGLEACVEAFSPELVGITAMTCEANTALAIASQVKSLCAAKVVVGGVHASGDPSFFNVPQVDYIVVGLGRASFKELADGLAAGGAPAVTGVAKTSSVALKFTPRKFTTADLADEMPPRYDLVEKYRAGYAIPALGVTMGFVATAAGCTHRCDFCCIGSLTNSKYLLHSTGSVLRDIATLADSVQLIRLVDANSFGDTLAAESLCEKIASAAHPVQYVADARADTVVRDPELFARWKKAGLRAVVVGFEEISDTRLKAMNKGSRTRINTEAIKILHDIGISVIGDFIVDPDYTPEEFDILEDYIMKNNVDLPMTSILTPLPGTALYERMRDRITIEDLDYYTLTNAVVPTRMESESFYNRFAQLLANCHRDARI